LQQEQAIQKAIQQAEPLTVKDDKEELLDAKLYRLALAMPKTESELVQYLQQERLLRDTNIYQYRKAKQYDYLVIAKIAKDYLAISVMSAPSESVFSISSDVVTKKRNRLTGDTVRFIIYLKT